MTAENGNMVRRALLLFAIVLGPALARADFVIHQRSESKVERLVRTEDTTIRIKSDQARIDYLETDYSTKGTNTLSYSRVMNLNTFDIYTWQPKPKEVVKMSGALIRQTADDTLARFADKIRPPPPQASGKIAMIGGYQTEIYNWTNIAGVRMELWVAKDFPNYKEINRQFERLNGPPETLGLTSLDFAKLPSMMLRLDRFRGSTNLSSYFLVSAKEEPVADSAFVIPGDWPIRDLENDEKRAAKIQSTLNVGAKFPEFNEKGVDGKPLSLADYKGKVVLIDFWATWCGPCRGEIPNVVASYQKYHGKGFEVIGVSLDQDRQKLLDYTRQQNMTWQQYFDGQGWSNKLAAKYGIESIPATYLLDGNGKIIGQDLRGDALGAAVAKALANK
jgi:thiol-disulfide isomerase/thioredoxin